MTPQVKQSTRELRRLQTRERILGAAIAEFAQSGMAGADVGAIVSARAWRTEPSSSASPARSTSCWSWRAAKKARWQPNSCPLPRSRPRPRDGARPNSSPPGGCLEQRLRPDTVQRASRAALLTVASAPTTNGPIILVIVRARPARSSAPGDGEVHPEVDAFYSAAFFLLGYLRRAGTTTNSRTRDAMLANLVITARRGLEVR